jgi:hypothetical protein
VSFELGLNGIFLRLNGIDFLDFLEAIFFADTNFEQISALRPKQLGKIEGMFQPVVFIHRLKY